MSIRICICDDNPTDLQTLRTLTEQWSDNTAIPCFIETFPSAEAFLFRYGEDRRVDILLLDVEMVSFANTETIAPAKRIDGIQLARQLRGDSFSGEIVFVTSHREFWDAGYEVDALHYLTKPVAGDKLKAVLTRAAEKVKAEPPSLVITCDGETFRLPLHDILYVEASRHYITITTQSGVYRLKEGLTAFGEKLGDDFYRIHRGIIVSLPHITRISRTSVWVGQTELPLARGNYDGVNRAFIDRVDVRTDTQSGERS